MPSSDRRASIIDSRAAKAKFFAGTEIFSLGSERPEETAEVQANEIYVEDITRRREDMNFIFEWLKTIFYERAQRVSKILFFFGREMGSCVYIINSDIMISTFDRDGPPYCLTHFISQVVLSIANLSYAQK